MKRILPLDLFVSRRSLALVLAVLFGGGTFAWAAGTTTMCYQGKTIEVPNEYVETYKTRRGATVGACQVTPS